MRRTGVRIGGRISWGGVRWAEFSRTDTVFWDCPGIHAKMLNTQHMAEFVRTFKRAMKRRGV